MMVTICTIGSKDFFLLRECREMPQGKYSKRKRRLQNSCVGKQPKNIKHNVTNAMQAFRSRRRKSTKLREASAAQAAAARPAGDGYADFADDVYAELNSLPDEVLDVLCYELESESSDEELGSAILFLKSYLYLVQVSFISLHCSLCPAK